MGYSTTAIASLVFDEMLALLRDDDSLPSNGWRVARTDYFVDVSRNDQSDGGICGSAYKLIPGRQFTDTKQYAQRIGTVKIDGKGAVLRWPTSTKQQRNAAYWKGTAEYVRKYGNRQLVEVKVI